MELFLELLQKEVKKMNEGNIRIRIIGDQNVFSEEIQEHIVNAEKSTAKNTGLALNIAVNYGGRLDIIHAIKNWQVQHPGKELSELTEDDISQFISLSDQPLPDLLIRTGGEQRISNFLIWQTAYAELYFSDELWPDFNEKSIDKAIESFAGRERRFGKTSEQITNA